MSSLPSRFRDNLREVRVGRDQDIGRLPQLRTSPTSHSHEQSCGGPHSRQRKVRPDIRAAHAAALANETRLQVGQPDPIGPLVDFGRCHRFQMAASVIGAIDPLRLNQSSWRRVRVALVLRSCGNRWRRLRRGSDRCTRTASGSSWGTRRRGAGRRLCSINISAHMVLCRCSLLLTVRDSPTTYSA